MVESPTRVGVLMVEPRSQRTFYGRLRPMFDHIIPTTLVVPTNLVVAQARSSSSRSLIDGVVISPNDADAKT